MLLSNGDGTYVAGPFDLMGVLHDRATGRYHACVWEEKPLPGGEQLTSTVRLKSKMHHTEGAKTLEAALAHVESLRKKVMIADVNVWTRPDQVYPVDGKQGFVTVRIERNWRTA